MRLFLLSLATLTLGVSVATAQSREARTPERIRREKIAPPTCLDQRSAVTPKPRPAPRAIESGCGTRTVFVDENPGDSSTHVINDPDGRWWIRLNMDGAGRLTRMWGRNAEGRYWIRIEDLKTEPTAAPPPAPGAIIE